MFRSTIQAAPRRITASRTAISSSRSSARRLLSTAPPSQKSRSWKSGAARWVIAGAGVYYYNTSNVFAEEPEAAIQRLDDSLHNIQESKQPTLDAIVEEKRHRQAQAAAEEQKKQRLAEGGAEGQEADGEDGEGGLEGLEEEAGQEGAFNPETGEINWDCPCLGGMAHGPCGDEFKAAFSCFVYSNEEPKGVECIDKFKGMQDCFRLHPEMYGSELEDDEDELEDEIRARESGDATGDEPSKSHHTQETEDVSGNAATPPPQKQKADRGSYQDSKDATSKPSTPSKASGQSDDISGISSQPLQDGQKAAAEPYRDSSDATAKSAKTSPSGNGEKPGNGDEGGELVPRAAFDATSK